MNHTVFTLEEFEVERLKALEALQCLVHTAQLSKYLKKRQHSQQGRTGFSLICALEELVERTFSPASSARAAFPASIAPESSVDFARDSTIT